MVWWVLFSLVVWGERDEGNDVGLLFVFEDAEALMKGRRKLYEVKAESDFFMR